MTEFSGFEPATISFLQELEANNNRDWFNKNKQRYDEVVLTPAFALISAMGPLIDKISQYFEAVPKRSGGSLMRVYRDTRFSKDKTPYKTNIGIQFRHELGKDVHAPGYYMHIEPGDLFVGVGMWHPESGALAAIRNLIVDKPALWKKASHAKAFRSQFELQGESLKRPPRGFDPEHPLIDDLKRKDFIAVTSLDWSTVSDPGLPKTLIGVFNKATPLMRFLCQAVEVPF